MGRVLAVVLLGALALAGGIALLRQSPPPATVVERQPSPPAVEAPARSAVAPGAAAPDAQQGSASPETGQVLPRFDVVRVDAEDNATVAGTAEPGATVTVIVDDEVVATLQADRSGAFAGFVDLPRSQTVRRIELSARRGEGPEQRGDEPVFVGSSSVDAPEPPRPTVAIARPDGVELVQEPARGDDGAVTLDLVSVTEAGFIAASGRGNVLRLVRLYANAVFVAETMVREDGTWSVSVAADLPPGRHTLRVDEIGADGRVASRIEQPFERLAVATAALRPGQIVVEPGNTLWRLAEQAYGSGLRFTVIYEANADRIRDPDLIFPGQVITLPALTPRP